MHSEGGEGGEGGGEGSVFVSLLVEVFILVRNLGKARKVLLFISVNCTVVVINNLVERLVFYQYEFICMVFMI